MGERISAPPRNFFGKFKSIRSAMMVSFSVIIVIALITFMILSINYTRNAVLENAITYSTNAVEQVNEDIDSYINYMENISSIVLNSTDVQTYLFSEQSVEELEEEETRILSQMETILDTNDDIGNIAVVADNGRTIVDTTETLNQYVDIETLEWYQDTMESAGGINISSSHVQNLLRSSYNWVITLSRAVINIKNGRIEGILFVDLNYESISALCENNQTGNKGYTFIIDDEGNIIYHPKQQLLYGGLATERTTELLELTDNYLITEEGDDSRLYTMSTSEKTGWTVVSVAYISELLKDSNNTRMMYLIIACILLIITIIISNIIVSSITKPIARMRNSMKLVEQGQFEGVEIEVSDNNELGMLSESFNTMTYRISELMEQNIYEQKEKRKNEMRALQAQINPHFLYNTLDSIIWMSAAGKTDEVVDMTSALAKLFRQSISNEKEELTISEEIDYVKSYLTIQKMRYKDKMDYCIDVEEQIQTVPIIKFALQPLVENAIYHGLKYKENQGTLTIKGYAGQDKVYIEVIDDGVGMTENELRYIFDEKQTDYKNNGVGVVNVEKRLKLYYGIEYGIQYQSEKGVGTTATVTVPLNGVRSNETSE